MLTLILQNNKQAEKELQASKSSVLSSKLASIRSAEQRCSALDQKIASQNVQICLLKSEIERLDAKYESASQQLRLNFIILLKFLFFCNFMILQIKMRFNGWRLDIYIYIYLGL